MENKIVEAFRERVDELDDYVNNHMFKVNQISIDLVENFQEDFFHRHPDDGPITRDDMGSESWKILLVLDIMDKEKFPHDLHVFTEMNNICTEWEELLEKEMWLEFSKTLPAFDGTIENLKRGMLLSPDQYKGLHSKIKLTHDIEQKSVYGDWISCTIVRKHSDDGKTQVGPDGQEPILIFIDSPNIVH